MDEQYVLDEFFNESWQQTFFLQKNEPKKQGGIFLCWFILNNLTFEMVK
jgi:hypothetical protein